MAHATAKSVQGWLQATKLKIDEVDPALDDACTNTVFGQLQQVYVTTTWVDESTTPSLVQTILSLTLASYYYRRAYAEVSEAETGYATWLEDEADAILQLIIGGSITIPGGVLVASNETQPIAVPDNTTGSTQQYDAQGNLVGQDQYSEDIKFRMGSVF